ncbi:MAG TPA: type III-B CRISPR-associated protein Cas10/Cmr2, partial [Nitrososphaera sp.]|nr:type III-B CRISPR-associated protein Cas10/Cmr2 [Nitrososphaera sp.]
DDDVEYQTAREKVEYLFAARKGTRHFTSAKEWSDSVPKSSLDGQRESVIHEDIYDDVRKGKTTKEQLRLQFGVREGERLCGVGLLKRHGNRKRRVNSTNDDSFFSTSHVASLPLLETLTDKSAVEKYINRLKEIGISEFNRVPIPKGADEHPAFGRNDGHLLFEERLGDYFEKDDTGKKKLEDAREALRNFLKIALGNKKPKPYYALLLADGDAMGKAIDAQTSRKKHQELSGELSQFAKEVRELVEIKHKGSLIYSGGDDVLAFIPLHTVLACAKDLADSFARKLARFEITENDKAYSPTLSVGIAVMHHLDPLEDALELARKAEKAAKAVKGKNALAVIIDKRSGVSRMLKGRWGTIDKRLKQLIKWHQEKEALNSAAYQLRDLANRLEVSENVSDEDKVILQRAKLAEAKRILERKEIREEALQELKNFLDDIREVLKEDHLSKGKDEKDFVDKSVEVLADELIIAKIFADAKNLAEGKKTNG